MGEEGRVEKTLIILTARYVQQDVSGIRRRCGRVHGVCDRRQLHLHPKGRATSLSLEVSHVFATLVECSVDRSGQ